MPHPPHVPVQVAAGQQLGHRVLHRLGHLHAEVDSCPGEHRDQVGPGQQPARAERRGQRLRRGAQVDDHLGVQAEQRRQRADVVAELAVVVVLHDERPGGPGPGRERLTAGHRQPPAQRVLMRGRGVHQPQPGRQLVHHQPVRVHPARHQLGAVRGEHRPGRLVARLLHADPVARPEQAARDQLQARRDPAGDQDLVPRAAQAPAAAQVADDLIAQRGQAARVRPAGHRLGGGPPPGPAPGGLIDPGHPGDAGAQVDPGRRGGGRPGPGRGYGSRPGGRPARPGRRAARHAWWPGAPGATKVPEPCRPSSQPSANSWV